MDEVYIVTLDSDIVAVCATRMDAEVVWGDVSITLPDDRWVDDNDGMPTIPTLVITHHEVIDDA